MTLLQPLCRDRNLQATVDKIVGLNTEDGKVCLLAWYRNFDANTINHFAKKMLPCSRSVISTYPPNHHQRNIRATESHQSTRLPHRARFHFC